MTQFAPLHAAGHRNAQTVKGVAFAGAEDELVASGSDCGHLFLWNKARRPVSTASA